MGRGVLGLDISNGQFSWVQNTGSKGRGCLLVVLLVSFPNDYIHPDLVRLRSKILYLGCFETL